MRQKYMILAGASQPTAVWQPTNPITVIGLKRRLTKERQGGHWAQAWHIRQGLECLKTPSERVQYLDLEAVDTGDKRRIGCQLKRVGRGGGRRIH